MLSSLIASVVSGEASEAVGRARRAAIVYILAGLFALCGVGFLLGAAFVASADRFGAIHAALGFGGGFILLALIVVAIHKAVSRAKEKRAKKRMQSEMAAVASAAALAALPTLLAGGKGRSAALLAPALAALGWAIWRENKGHRRPADPDRP